MRLNFQRQDGLSREQCPGLWQIPLPRDISRSFLPPASFAPVASIRETRDDRRFRGISSWFAGEMEIGNQVGTGNFRLIPIYDLAASGTRVGTSSI